MTTAAELASYASSFPSFRNRIINGNFDIWQRGTSQTSAGYGSADRWVNLHAGSTKTASQQAFTAGQTDVPGNPKNYLRHVVSSVAAAANYVTSYQKIEGVDTLSGQTATVSFWAKADSNKNIATEFFQYFGSGGSPSSQVNAIGVTTHSLTTSWQKFTATVAIPSISGKTIGSDGNDYLGFVFFFDAGSDWNSRTNSLGNQSGTFDIAQVQVEEGTVATPFEHRPTSVELSLAQRYYQKSFPMDVAPAQNIGGNGALYCQGHAANAPASGFVIFPTPMRDTPSIFTTYNPSAANANWRNLATATDINKVLYSSSSSGFFLYSNTQVLSQYEIAAIHWSAHAEL